MTKNSKPKLCYKAVKESYSRMHITYIDVFDTVRINVELQSLWEVFSQREVFGKFFLSLDSIQNVDKLFCEKKILHKV